MRPATHSKLKWALLRVLTFIEEDVPAILLAVIVVALTADVIGRYVFSSPLQSASEVALICFIWLVYLAVAAVARHGRHIAIDVLTTILPARVQAIVEVFVQLLSLAVMAYLIYNGAEFFANGHFTSLTGTGLSKKYLEIAIPISAILMAAYSVRDLVHAVTGAVTGVFVRTEDELDDEISRIDESYLPDNLKQGA